jgi:hypothetical protein
MTGNANAKEMSSANGAKDRSRKSPRAILIAALSGSAAPHLPHFGLRVMEYAGSRLIALQELQRTSRLFISGLDAAGGQARISAALHANGLDHPSQRARSC